MAEFVKVAKVADVPPGTGKVVEVGGTQVAVFNHEGTFHAINNTCPHRGGPLGEGALDGITVTCPWHGWEFDVTSGVCTMNPEKTVQRFSVKVDGEDLLVCA